MTIRQEVTVTHICDCCGAESESRGSVSSEMNLKLLNSKRIFPVPEDEVSMWLCEKCTMGLRTWIRARMGFLP